MSIASQNTRILKHLESGKTLTAVEALNKFQCFRLAARIKNLKDSGHSIDKNMITSDGKSKSYAEYFLINPQGA